MGYRRVFFQSDESKGSVGDWRRRIVPRWWRDPDGIRPTGAAKEVVCANGVAAVESAIATVGRTAADWATCRL